MKNPLRLLGHYRERIRLSRKTFILYSVLRMIVILTAIRCAFERNYESLALCILSLVLFLLPAFFEERFKVDIPPLFEAIIYAFIFSAEILGEVNKYYTAIPGWDTLLHTLNGFLCAAIGFSMVDILNRQNKRGNLSPFYLAMTAFCFSMTVGVIWEFIEFAGDQFFYLDMQKDFVVKNIASVTLDPTNSQIPVKISDITRTVIETADGTRHVISGGYLDIGILDTMKDLLVNFVGAIVFSAFGYFYVKKRDEKNNFVEKLILRTMTDEEVAQQEALLRQQEKHERRKYRRTREKMNADSD